LQFAKSLASVVVPYVISGNAANLPTLVPLLVSTFLFSEFKVAQQ